MNTKDHYILAKEIAGSFKNFGGKIRRILFIAGCVAPDINVFTYIKGHMFNDRRQFLSRILNSEKISFYNIGVLIHYISDSFTFPHNSDFRGNMSQHRSYENKLHRFIANDFGRFAGKINIPRKSSLSEMFTLLHDEYTAGKKSYENDCQYIYAVCREITGKLLRLV